MSYTPIALSGPIILQGGYTPPPLSAHVVLGEVEAYFSASIPAVVSPISASIHAQLAALGIIGAGLTAPSPSLSASIFAEVRMEPPAVMAAYLEPVDPAISAAMVAQMATLAAVSAQLPSPSPGVLTGDFQAVQDISLPDITAIMLRAGQRQTETVAEGASVPQQQAVAVRRPALAQQQQGMRREATVQSSASETLRTQQVVAERHAYGLPLLRSSTATHADTLRARRAVAERHAHGLPLSRPSTAPHTDTLRARRRISGYHRHASAAWVAIPAAQQRARKTAGPLNSRQQQGEKPQPGWWWPWYTPPSLSIPVVLQPGYTPRPLSCPVVLGYGYVTQPSCGGGNVPDPVAFILIPTLRTYHVLNDVTLKRLPDMLPLPADNLNIKIDEKSWCWGWSASIPGQFLDEVMPAPDDVEVLASVNGKTWRLRIDDIGRDRRFGKNDLVIGARGRAADLADPNSPEMLYGNPDDAMTAWQLAIAAVTAPGLPIGWEIDWQLEDWLVPRGVWSHQGTPISAVTRIAESGGGYVQADPENQVLHILPRYRVLPWNWDTTAPDIEIPVEITVTEGIRWLKKPAYNRVYVSGQSGGRLARVTRAGTAGDFLAPHVTDPLNTHAYSGRQRGAAILADTGPQARQTISMPVLEGSGFVFPGTLSRFTEPGQPHRVGVTRSLDIRCNFPDVVQTVEVETHGN